MPALVYRFWTNIKCLICCGSVLFTFFIWKGELNSWHKLILKSNADWFFQFDKKTYTFLKFPTFLLEKTFENTNLQLFFLFFILFIFWTKKHFTLTELFIKIHQILQKIIKFSNPWNSQESSSYFEFKIIVKWDNSKKFEIFSKIKFFYKISQFPQF